MSWTQGLIFDDLGFLASPVRADFSFERKPGLSAEGNTIDNQLAQAPTQLRAPTPRTAQSRPQSVSRPSFNLPPLSTVPTAGSSIATNGYGTVIAHLDNKTKQLEDQVAKARADIKTIHSEVGNPSEWTQVLAEFELMRKDFEEVRQHCADVRARVQKLVEGLKQQFTSMDRDFAKHEQQLQGLNKFATDWTATVAQSEEHILGNMKLEAEEFMKEGEGFI